MQLQWCTSQIPLIALLIITLRTLRTLRALRTLTLSTLSLYHDSGSPIFLVGAKLLNVCLRKVDVDQQLLVAGRKEALGKTAGPALALLLLGVNNLFV